jgi:pyrimidine oxygenase
VQIMRELWSTGRSDFKGSFFQMDDCVLSPKPSRPIPIVGAGQSDRGMRFVAEYGDFNFVGSPGLNDMTATAGVVDRLRAAVSATGRDVGALLLLMVIAAETDDAAFAKWQHYKDGTDLEALQWQADQAGADTKAQDGSTASNLARVIKDPQPTGILKLIGSYESVARMLDEIAAIPGVKGVMMTFDDFIIGMEQFGEHIQPRMKSRAKALASAGD